MLSLITRRQPRAQSTGMSDWGRFFGMVSPRTKAGIPVDENRALNYSAVFAATRVISIGGSIPLHMHHAGQGGKRAESHPLDNLFAYKFNPDLDSGNARRLLFQWQANWGNADCEIQRDDYTGEVVALYPLEPWATVCEKSSTGERRWRYFTKDGERVLKRDQVFHLPNVITTDGVDGIGNIRAARESIGLGLATEQYGANWFGGDGVPRIVVGHEGPALPDDQRRAFREEWKSVYGNADGAKVAVLGANAKVTPIAISADDSQFLETRQHNVEEIARWYGIPPHLLQRMVQVTYNNAEILPIEFVKWTLLQYLEVWETAISTQLLTDKERDKYYAKHKLNALMRGDSQSRMEFYRGMTGIAVMTRNEVRALEDLEPIEGGDTFLVQGAMVPLDDDGRPESEFAGTAGGPGNTPEPEPQSKPEEEKPAKAIKAESVLRAVRYQLGKAQEKEAKRAAEEARKTGSFVSGIDTFYEQHKAILIESVAPLIEAVGHEDATGFVAAWCEFGKQTLLSAADEARTGAELEAAVKRVTANADWTDRPAKAITTLES